MAAKRKRDFEESRWLRTLAINFTETRRLRSSNSSFKILLKLNDFQSECDENLGSPIIPIAESTGQAAPPGLKIAGRYS